MQLDRAARGFSGLFMELTDTDESWHRARIDASSPAAAVASLRSVIG